MAEPTNGNPPLALGDANGSAEQIRRQFADAWGEIGAAWGVAPSTASVQGYLLVHGGPLTEPEIRRALGLSHRAASVALQECEDWGIIERAPAARRSGQRGPAAAAYTMVGDHWTWFRRVTAARKERETDPVLPVIDRCAVLAESASRTSPDDPELEDLARRLGVLREFVRLFDHGVAAFVDAEPAVTAHLFTTLGMLDDATVARLFRLAGELSAEELARALKTLSRLSPTAARRLLTLAGQPQLARLLGVG
jgi:DNA-binding transcriptional regulator GbsR (MarR family)